MIALSKSPTKYSDQASRARAWSWFGYRMMVSRRRSRASRNLRASRRARPWLKVVSARMLLRASWRKPGGAVAREDADAIDAGRSAASSAASHARSAASRARSAARRARPSALGWDEVARRAASAAACSASRAARSRFRIQHAVQRDSCAHSAAVGGRADPGADTRAADAGGSADADARGTGADPGADTAAADAGGFADADARSTGPDPGANTA